MAKKAIDKEYLARQFQNFWDKTKRVGNSRLIDGTISYSKVNSEFAKHIDYNDLKNLPNIPESSTVDSTLSTTSTNPVQNKVVTAALNGKMDKTTLATVATTGSYNDLTNKPTIPKEITIDAALSETSYNPVQNRIVKAAIDNKMDKTELATVATTGSYNDLTNKPTIPKEITIDAALSETSYNPVQNRIIKAALDKKFDKTELATVASTGSYNDLLNKPTIPKETTIDSALSETSYNPVQNKVIKAELDKKFDKIELATVASTGSYNDLTNKPTIPKAITIDAYISDSSANPVQNKVIKTELDKKVNASSLASVATTGRYSSLTGAPTTAEIATNVLNYIQAAEEQEV